MRDGFDVSYFVPYKLSSDVCGENGLPVCPNNIRILGIGKVLSSVRDAGLQRFIDIESGNQGRLIIVHERLDSSAQLKNTKGAIKPSTALTLAKLLFKTLSRLHRRGFVHQDINTANIYFNEKHAELVLQDWFRGTLTGFGSMGHFSRTFKYCSPEDIIKYVRGISGASDYSSDVFSAGMVLTEILLGKKLWRNVDDFSLMKARLNLLKSGLNTADAIAEQLSLSSHFNDLDPKLLKIVRGCTRHLASERLSVNEVLEILSEELKEPQRPISLFDHEEEFKIPSNATPEEIINGIPYTCLFQLWKLSGGDLDSELERCNVIEKQPGICMLQLVLDLDPEQGHEKHRVSDFFNKKIVLPMDGLITNFKSVNDVFCNPITSIAFNHSDDVTKSLNDLRKLPLTIREGSVLYQFHRILVFNQLLRGYPITRSILLTEARVDICPHFRGQIWCSLLNVQGDTRMVYELIDKCSRRETDRQIEVDIPRCHQYEPLIACPEGRYKLKRIIKAWLVTHPNLTYWQGVDSLTTPFLFINYNREDLAFATMTKFIEKYMQGLFERDNANVIQEYLAVFQQLITFHDPELAKHLSDMDGQSFVPDLYAISWFLTMFSHVFPIKKILYLWDTLLLQDSSFPLFVGVAIMSRLKRQLMSFTFNDCILSFSDMPDIDIHDVIKISLRLYRDTPKSCSFRVHQVEEDEDGVIGMNKDFIDLDERKSEIVPRISPADVCRLAAISRKTLLGSESREGFQIISHEDVLATSVIDRVFIIDIRSENEFNSGTFPNAVNLPAELAFEPPTEKWPFGSLKLSNLVAINLVRSRGKSVLVICGNSTKDAQAFAFQLFQLGYPKLCCLSGGFDNLDQIGATLTVPF